MKVRSCSVEGASCRLRVGLLAPLAIISLMALWPAVLLLIFEEYPSVLLPTVLDHICGYLALFVLMRVRSPLLLVSGYVWIAWYFIGTINVIASSLVLGNYYSNLDISKAAHIYLAGCLAYVLGCLVFENIFPSVQRGMMIHPIQSTQSQHARMFRELSHHNIDTVIDVGANNGGYGRFLRKGGYQADILSFEPLEEAHRALMLAAAGDPRWQVAPRAALGTENGQIQINVSGNSTSSSVLAMRPLHAEAAPDQ